MASVYFGCFCFQVFDGILLHGKLRMKHEDNFCKHYKVDDAFGSPCLMFVCDVSQSTQKNYMLHSGTQFLHLHICTCTGLDQIVLILVTRIERRKFGQKGVYDI